jgi:dTMP kinase
MSFIVFEGLDGAGKSTQIKMLAEFLGKSGRKVFSFHFPNMNAPRFGSLIARFLRGDFGDNNQVDPYVVASLYAGDRFDASEMLKEKMTQYDFVIVDRYVDSNIAYQCAKMNKQEEKQKLKEWILDLEYQLYRIPMPDTTLFFDVPFDFVEQKLSELRTGEDREYLKGKKDIHETNMGFQEKVREEYIKLFENRPEHHIINCSNEKGKINTAEDIFKSVMLVLKSKL